MDKPIPGTLQHYEEGGFFTKFLYLLAALGMPHRQPSIPHKAIGLTPLGTMDHVYDLIDMHISKVDSGQESGLSAKGQIRLLIQELIDLQPYLKKNRW